MGGGKHNKGCCDRCELASDDFNRADGPVSGKWHGSGAIVSGVLHADEDHTTVCHPASAPLGSLWGHALMVACDPSRTYKVRVGDPTGDYTITVTFSGVVRPGTGTMTITVETGADTVTHDFPWENVDETLYVCYAPGVQLSAGPTSRVLGENPAWVSACIPEDPHDKCWTVDSTSVGNWEFVSGYWDDWVMEIFESEKEICNDCDCYCLEGDVKHCVPETLQLTIGGSCVAGTYQMRRRRIVTSSYTAAPVVELWPENYTWISDPVSCPNVYLGGYMGFVVIVQCEKIAGQEYPKWLATLQRWGSNLSSSSLGFDASDPDTLSASIPGAFESISQAHTKSGSSCDPVYLELPDIIETLWTTPGTGNCCGGGIFSGTGSTPPVVMSAEISE